MSEQIAYIKLLGVQEGFNMYKYKDPAYSLEQIVEIYRGYREGLDVSVFDDVEVPADKMHVLRECLYSGISASRLNQTLSVEYLNELLDASKRGLDLSYLECTDLEELKCKKAQLIEYTCWSKLLINESKNEHVVIECFLKGFKLSQIKIISKCLNEGLDVTYLLDSSFSDEQLEQLYLMLHEGLDIKLVAKPEISWIDMAIHRLKN